MTPPLPPRKSAPGFYSQLRAERDSVLPPPGPLTNTGTFRLQQPEWEAIQDSVLRIHKKLEQALEQAASAERERELAAAAARGAQEALEALAKKAKEDRDEARAVEKIARERHTLKLTCFGLALAATTGVVFHLLHI